MKLFKHTDWIISATLILGFIVSRCWEDLESLIRAYLVVGGWQLVSMIVHAIHKWFTAKYGIRHIYHWISFIAVVTLPGSCYFLLFLAPFMAVFYTVLCISEVLSIKKRPLALLK